MSVPRTLVRNASHAHEGTVEEAFGSSTDPSTRSIYEDEFLASGKRPSVCTTKRKHDLKGKVI